MFCIIGEERTKKGRKHWQGYVEMKKKLSFKQLKRLFGRTCHIEVAKKPAINNIKYCAKEGKLFHMVGNPSEQRAARLLAHFSSSQKHQDAKVPQKIYDEVTPIQETAQFKQSSFQASTKVPLIEAKDALSVTSVCEQRSYKKSNNSENC